MWWLPCCLNACFWYNRYYELEVITTGFMMVGWAHGNAVPHRELGCDGTSYVFDGQTVSNQICIILKI